MVAFDKSRRRDFDDPYSFAVERLPNEHIAFGKCEHFCAGAHLARLELCLMLKALLTRIERVELAGKMERLKSILIAGIKHMPVSFTRAHAVA